MKRLRLNVPLIMALILLTLLAVILVLPWFVNLAHPQVAKLSLFVGNKLRTPPYAPGEAGYLLGSDTIGRDRLSRLIYGARYTLGLAGAVTALRLLCALPLGLFAGWRNGWLGRLVQMLSAGFSSFPNLVLTGLVLWSLRFLFLRESVWIGVYLTVVTAAGVPRLAEAVRLRTREVALLPHIETAVSAGATPARMLRRHVLPLMGSELLILAASEMAWALLLMGQLALFGIFIGGEAGIRTIAGTWTALQEYWPEWSMMMGISRSAILHAAWLPLAPGTALALTALCFHLLAEGIRLRWASKFSR